MYATEYTRNTSQTRRQPYTVYVNLSTSSPLLYSTHPYWRQYVRSDSWSLLALSKIQTSPRWLGRSASHTVTGGTRVLGRPHICSSSCKYCIRTTGVPRSHTIQRTRCKYTASVPVTQPPTPHPFARRPSSESQAGQGGCDEIGGVRHVHGVIGRPYRSIQGHTCLYQSIQGHTRPYRSIQGPYSAVGTAPYRVHTGQVAVKVLSLRWRPR